MFNGYDKRVLITGSTGMVGGNIASFARKVGWSVFTPTRAELDLTDSSSVTHYLAKTGIESIIHCAAKVGGIAANIAAPANFIIENIRIDSSIISSARTLGIPDFIYFASSCIYPRSTSQPMRVDQLLTSTLEPTNESYALAKLVGAKSVAAVAIQDELNWRVLIPSNLYGPRDNFNESSSHLVPAVIQKIYRAILNKEKSVQIWGNGETRREFTFVEDVANFVVSNFYNVSKWPLLMNIGYGKDFSVNEYYRVIASALSFTGTFLHDLSKPVGMTQKLLDSEISKEYGWMPQTDLESGINLTLSWFKENVAHG